MSTTNVKMTFPRAGHLLGAASVEIDHNAYRELQEFWNEVTHAWLQQVRKPLACDNLLTINNHDEQQRQRRHSDCRQWHV